MPMLPHDKDETVQRLATAHDKTKEILESEPVALELHAGTEIASNWTVITAAYSGLEQTIKYLIADENGQTIAELIRFREGKARPPYLTHHLCDLFLRLPEPLQQRLREFYARYQSLHCYVETETLDAFLSEISDEDGRGYERWRYTLIDDTPPPRISPEALLAVWGACIQITKQRIWENQRLRMPEEVLARELYEALQAVAMDVSGERQDVGEPFQDINPEIRQWLRRNGHPLNAFADVLWHFSRYAEHGQPNVSRCLAEALTSWAEGVLACPAVSRRTSLRRFVAYAKGDTPHGQSVRWDRGVERFKAVPWCLESRQQDARPPGAVPVGELTPRLPPLSTLWRAAKESGYRVLENRGFIVSGNQKPWIRTHEVRTVAKNGDDARPILTMWRQPNERRGLFFMVEEQPREEMGDSVRNWVETAVRLGELRTRSGRAE